uniref:DUF2428 domain-containing protein n=1 Tax=Strongyloides stercoralis TaxID=6248 RepID=A0A0K0ENH0_STRER
MTEEKERFYPTIGVKSAVNLGRKLLSKLLEKESKDDLEILSELVYKIDIMRYIEFKDFIKTELYESCKNLLENDYLNCTSAYFMDFISQCLLMEFYYFGKKNSEEIRNVIDSFYKINNLRKSPIHCLGIYSLEKAIDINYNGNILVNWDNNLKYLVKNPMYNEKFINLIIQHFHSLYDVYENKENLLDIIFRYSLDKEILNKVVMGLSSNAYLVSTRGSTFVPLLIKCLLKLYGEQFNDKNNGEPVNKKSKKSFDSVSTNPISESIFSIVNSNPDDISSILKKISKNGEFQSYCNNNKIDSIVVFINIFDKLFSIFRLKDNYLQIFSSLLISMKALPGNVCIEVIKYLNKMLSSLNTSFANEYLIKITFNNLVYQKDFVNKFQTQQAYVFGEFVANLLVTKTQIKDYTNAEKFLKYLTDYIKTTKKFHIDGEVTNVDIITIIAFYKMFHVMNLKRHINEEYFKELQNIFISFASTVNSIMIYIPNKNNQEINDLKILEKFASLFNAISIIKFILKEIDMDGEIIEDKIVSQIYKISAKCLNGSYFHDLVIATFDTSLIFTESFNFLFYAHHSLNKPFQVLKWKFLCNIVKNNELLMNKVLDTTFTNNEALQELLEALKPYSLDELDLISIFKVIGCIATKKGISFVPVVPYLMKAVVSILPSLENIISSLTMLKTIIKNVRNEKNSLNQVLPTTILLLSSIDYNDFKSKQPKFIITSLNLLVSTVRNILKCDNNKHIITQASLISGIIGKLVKFISEIKYFPSYNVNPNDILHSEHYIALAIKSLKLKKDIYRRLSPYTLSVALGYSRKLTLPYMYLLMLCDKKGIDLVSAKIPLSDRQRFKIIYQQFTKYRISVG